MRSLQNEASAHCPNGCEEFDVTYWSLVRGDENDDLKNAILGGELNLVGCPECGTYFHHDGEIIYFDAPAELLTFVFSPKDKTRAQELTDKIEHDYEVIKNSLLKELHAWLDATVHNVRKFHAHNDFPMLRGFYETDFGRKGKAPSPCVCAIDGGDFAVGVCRDMPVWDGTLPCKRRLPFIVEP